MIIPGINQEFENLILKNKNIIELTEDGKYIKSKTKVSGNSDNLVKLNPGKNLYLENLQKEIHLNTDYIAKKMNNLFIQELPILEKTNDKIKKNFVDLVGIYDKELFFMAEYKRIKNYSNIQEEVNKTFIQLLDYVDKYFEKYNNNIINKIVLSIVVFNDKWLENPTYIDKFYDFLNIEESELTPEEFLEKYGIYIETKFYDLKEKKLENKTMFNFPVIFKVKEVNYKNNINPLIKFENIETKMLIEFNELNKIPTRTSDFKITNSREILDITDPRKKELILEILTTILEGYKSNKNYIMRKFPTDFCVVYLKDETKGFIQSKNDIDKDINYYYFLSNNVALVDGQQKFSALKTIKKLLEDNNLNTDEKKFKKILVQKIAKDMNIEESYITNDELYKLAKYIEKLEFYVDIVPALDNNDAKKISKRRNNTIPQDKNFIKLLEYEHYYRFLNYKIFEKYGKKLYFPNITDYTGTVLKYFPVYGILNLYEMIINDKVGIYSNNLSNIEIYIRTKSSFNKFKTKIKDSIKIINVLLRKNYQNKDEELENIILERENYKKELDKLKIKLKELEKEKNVSDVIQTAFRIKDVENIIKELDKKIQEIKDLNAKIIDFRNDEVKENIYFIFEISDYIINKIQENQIYRKFFKFNNEEITEYWLFVILGYLMKKAKLNNKKLHEYEIDSDFIKNNLEKIINGLIKITEYEGFNITDINNKKVEELKKMYVYDKEYNKYSYYDIFEENI